VIGTGAKGRADRVRSNIRELVRIVVPCMPPSHDWVVDGHGQEIGSITVLSSTRPGPEPCAVGSSFDRCLGGLLVDCSRWCGGGRRRSEIKIVFSITLAVRRRCSGQRRGWLATNGAASGCCTPVSGPAAAHAPNVATASVQVLFRGLDDTISPPRWPCRSPVNIWRAKSPKLSMHQLPSTRHRAPPRFSCMLQPALLPFCETEVRPAVERGQESG
jgi:hypothetical protein